MALMGTSTSIDIREGVELGPMTTLGIGGPARYFVEVHTKEALREAVGWAHGRALPIFILGGGSNVLVSDNGFDGLVIKPHFVGITILESNIDFARIKIGASEVLDEVIEWTVGEGLWGMENLSFVPGRVGATAIMNVGCYGAQSSDFIESVEVFDRQTGEIKELSREQCKFGYRRSCFSDEDKGRYIILSITVKLRKIGEPNLSYIDVRRYFDNMRVRAPNQGQVRYAITQIRKGKGQDTSEYKSAGSFFKNLRLSDEEYQILHNNIEGNFGAYKAGKLDELKDRFRELDAIKIPTGFILDKILNLHGLYVDGAALSPKQIIMITNTGNATSRDVMKLFGAVRKITHKKTGMKLVNEPELVGFTHDELEICFEL